MSSTSSSIATSTQSSLGVFESAGGPPLILVCIAVGLLVGVFAGVIIMRRIRPHPVVAPRTPDGFFRASEQRFGEKPLLCDLHPNPVAWPEYDGKENRWEKVVPLAATFFPSESSPPLRDPEIAAPSPRPSTPARTGFPTFLPRRRQPSTNPSAVFTTPPPQPAEPGRLQVAVAVSMPAHREYCLGLAKVPWHAERNAAGQPEAGSN